jgi:hypothetical protein
MSNYLDKYNPQTSIFTHFKVDENLPVEEKAFETWKALLLAKRSHDGLFLVIGKLLKDVRDEKLYEKLDYENFGQFLASEELGFSREKAYMCIKTYEFYIEVLQLDPEKIGQMNVSRLSLMVPMLKQIEDKKEVVRQIEEMSNLRHGDFVREVKNRTSRGGKPNVYFSEELGKWYVGYHPNTTYLQNIGDFQQGEILEGVTDET